MKKYNRRAALKNIALTTGMMGLGTIDLHFAQTKETLGFKELKGNVNHSACRWCYANIPLESFASQAANMGLKAIDLLKPSEWDIVEKKGLLCSMATDDFASITHGFNDRRNHPRLQKLYKDLIDKSAGHGIKNVICFSGNKRGLTDKEGWENCAVGLGPLLQHAQKKNVNLVMELLNSRVNHPDYQCDHTKWGVNLADKIQAPNFKLLYDIYHMQIMEGDVIATIRKYHPYINHYHTGGVPGRNEIDNSQELNYPAIVKAILETGYKGYLAQEFVPTENDKIAALKKCVHICDV